MSAIEKATNGHRKVAVLLGGLDSSAVLALLTRLRPADTIHAITVDFPGADPDRPYAEQLCRQLGVRWTVVEPKEWLPLERFMLMDATPYAMLYGGGELAAYLKAAEVGCDCVVTAILGDAVFGGYLGHLGSRLLWQAPLRALRLAFGVEMPDDYSRVQRLRRFLVAPNVRERIPKAVRIGRTRRRWRAAMPWATDDFHALLAPGFDICWRRYVVPQSPTAAFREWATSAELGGLVEVCDVLASEAGIAWREVLADRELLDFLCAIPIETLLDGGKFRGLLRRAVADVLPEPALSRKSKAEVKATVDVLVRERDRATLRDLARGAALERWGLVRPGQLARAFEQVDSHFWMWRFLVSEALLRQCDGS
jgi:asparagine synthetase B (glutamine-hydrolysing)